MNPSFVTSSISRDAGGLYFAMTNLAKNLHQADLQLEIYGLRDKHSTEDAQAWHPVPCHGLVAKGPSSLGYSPQLTKALLGGHHDLLHSHGIWQWPSAAVHSWHRKTRKPYLISPHGMLDPWALANSRWKKWIAATWYEKRHLRDAACIHALSQSEADSIRAYGLKNPICIIPNGVDLIDTETLKAEKLKSEKKTLLFLGRIHPKKGLLNAIKAWKQVLRSTLDEWQFVIAGWDQGGHEAEIKQLCRDLNLVYDETTAATFLSANCKPQTANSQIVFVGPAFGQEKDALLKSASAFILPSFSEGLPMSILEAWSYRLPVLMTDHCNLPEGFTNNAAIRIDTDTESIVKGLHQLLQSEIYDLESISQNGRKLVEHQFSWSQVSSQMKEVYEWLLGGGTKPDCVHF